jgi:hypothetical protein
LEAADVPQASIAPAIALSAGRADVALALAEDGAVDSLTELVFSIDDAIVGGGPGKLVEVAEQLARRDDLELALASLQAFYRDLSVGALDMPSSELGFSSRGEDIRERSASVSATASAARVSLIHQCIRAMRQNANRQASLDSLLFGLRNLR